MVTRLLTLMALLALLASLAATPARAGEHVIEATVIPGWRMADGTHMAGLRLKLKPGWKTYWRSPGDTGFAPQFDWRNSGNLKGVRVEWPSPGRYMQGGLLTIGYIDEVVLPLAISPKRKGQPITLKAALDLGVCQDVCIPVQLWVEATLPAARARPDPRINAALAARPYSARKAGVSGVSCRITPTADGLRLSASIRMPPAGGDEMVIVETGNPEVWVAPATSSRSGRTLSAETRLVHVQGRPFALNRSALRLTVLGRRYAVDIQGCPAG